MFIAQHSEREYCHFGKSRIYMPCDLQRLIRTVWKTVSILHFC